MSLDPVRSSQETRVNLGSFDGIRKYDTSNGVDKLFSFLLSLLI